MYLLFEHQSSPDRLMPYRLVRYRVRIWQQWLDQGEGGLPLPHLVPLVLYNGERRWTVGLRFEELLPQALRSELAPYVPSFGYELMDLSHVPDEALRGEVLERGRSVKVMDSRCSSDGRLGRARM